MGYFPRLLNEYPLKIIPSPMFVLWHNRRLILLLTVRELGSRFAGALFGRLWLFIAPLVMLGMYAYFFGEILQAKWSIGGGEDSLTSFAMLIFSGLIIHQFFSECLIKAPDLVLSNPNYVKKVIFPLEILAVVTLLSAVIQLFIGSFILLLVFAIKNQVVSYSWLFFPLVCLPLFLLTIGLVWIFAALGVFLRDLRQVMQFVSTLTLFMSPVFYPMDRLPEQLQFLTYVNPLIIAIEQTRMVIFQGVPPDWIVLGGYSAASLLIFLIGYYFFMRSKSAFADVL